MLGSMPDVHVTTDPMTVFGIVTVIGALAVVAVIVSFRAARIPDTSDEPFPPRSPGQHIETAPARKPVPPALGADRHDAGPASSTTQPERVAMFAIVGLIAAVAVIAIVVTARNTQLSYVSDELRRRD